MESLLAAAIVVMVALGGTLLLRQRANLARSQAMLTATLDNIAQGIVMLDAAGRIVVINRQAEQMFAGGTQALGFGALPGQNVPPGEATLVETRTEDGRRLEVRTLSLPDGSAVRTFTDVTAIRADAHALSAARDTAEIASRARADFLAVMSHEIRTPLGGIIGVAGLLQDMPQGSVFGTTQRHYVNVIQQSGEHLLQLINDILDFSRLDAGRLELEETAFDVRAVVRSAIDLLGSEAGRKGLSLDVEFDAEVPVRAGGDPGRIRQVLLNLVGNALKFTEAGGVRVHVGRMPAAPGALRLGVSVADTGIGMSPVGLERLFDEFVQGDSSISRRFGGSGLGLAISRRLIEQMGGTIVVESEPGAGSVFRFDVLLRARRASDAGGVAPRGQGAGGQGAGGQGAGVAPAAETVQPALVRTRPLRVLVAEDNPTNSLVITRLLERLGHRVVAVTDGLTAVEAAGETVYDVVLMDVMMPRMDGITATRHIRALPAPHGTIAIIGLTANAMPAEAEACREAGMTAFATKPIRIDRLAAVIGEALGTFGDVPAAAVGDGADQASPSLRTAENRTFDPAMLDVLVADQGRDAAAASVAGFLARAPDTLALLRTLAGIGDSRAVVHNGHGLAAEAASFGLMRAARAGLDMTEDDASVAAFTVLMTQGLDELRSWHRSVGV